MRNQPDIPSNRELARRLPCSHTTVNRWRRDQRWPFGGPPWPAKMLPAMRAWAAEELEDTGGRAFADDAPGAEPTMPAPGPWLLKWQDVADDSSPFCRRAWIGETLWGLLTMEDLESLANHITFAIGSVMLEQAQADGQEGLLSEVPERYYRGLMHRVAQDKPKAMAERMNRVLLIWLSDRFIDRPRWWAELAEPMEDPPPAWLARAEPLAHRAKAATGKARTLARESAA